jgi:hypothetical protein
MPLVNHKAWMLAAAVALAGAAAAEETPLLHGEAFAPPAACSVDPFADASLEQREQSLQRDCGRDRLNVKLDTPRVGAHDTGPNQVVVEVDQVLTRQVLDAFTASARLGWQGATQDGFSRLQTGRALLAANGRLRLHERWALDMNWGGELADGLRRRATMSGLWRPAEDHLLFAELAAEDGGVANVVGYRWWVVPGKAVVDLSARRTPDAAMVEPRIAFQVLGFAK